MKQKIKLIHAIGIVCCVFAIGTSITAGFIISANKIQGTSAVTVTFNYDNGQTKKFVNVKTGTRIEKPENPAKTGYGFTGWYNDEQLWDFDKFYVYRDLTLNAKWDYSQYSITYNCYGGNMPSDANYFYNIDSEFSLKIPTKTGSIFLGWFKNDGKQISKITPGTMGDLTVNAKWIDNVSIISTNTAKGNVEYYAKEDDYTKIVVNTIPVDNKFHLFKYWIDDDNNVVSEDETAEIPISFFESSNLRAVYINNNEENDWNRKNGVIPIFLDSEKTTVRYGMYPQDNICDPDLIEALDKISEPSFGDYYHYRGSYYYKKKSSLYDGGSLEYKLFKNGNEIFENENYWFKVQPIEWKIIKKNDTEATLLSTVITETVQYFTSYDNDLTTDLGLYKNNYEFSNLRQWLNNYFYSNSFIFNSTPLNETTVFNGPETAFNTTDEYCCLPTKEKVFSLSYLEYNSEYFTNKKRKVSATDLFIASGGLYGTTGADFLSSYIWTRSPYGTDGYSVVKINRSGGLNMSDGYSNYCGLQPAIVVNFSDII